MRTLQHIPSSIARIAPGAVILLTLLGLAQPLRATQLIAEHFNQAVADNSAIGPATGWTAWAMTNGLFADFTAATPNGNYPSMSRANNGGFGGVTGNAVLAVTNGVNSANAAMMWTNTTVSLHDCVVTNVVFYTKNNAAGSYEHVVVQVGGQWYASVQSFHDAGGNSVWAVNSFTFTNDAAAWRALNTNNLTLGATNVVPLPSGDIQGIGIYGFAFGSAAQKIRVDEFIVNGSLPSAPVAATPTASPSASVTAPTTVTLSAAVTGTAPLSYQWRKGGNQLADGPTGNGSTLSGSLSNQLVIATTSTADSGNYDVVVMNNYGTNISPVLAVTVSAAGVPPSVTNMVVTPSSGTNEVGGAPMSIQVGAAGTGPFTYQWRKSNVDIVNETNATVTLASAFTNAGSYTVVVTSAYGSVTSAPPTLLTVIDTTPPVITFPAGNPTNIVINTPFTPVYQATDNSGQAPNVVITGSVNTNACGSYTLQFTANDAYGNTNTANLVVTVLLINERFNETSVDNAAVSNAPGWHASARAVATTLVTDYTGTGGNANFPSLSENVTSPDVFNGLGFLVMGEVANANPSLVWKDTTTLLANQQITNLTFYTRNNSALNTVQVAVRIGTNWYVSATTFTDASGGAVPWVAQSFDFTNDPAAWQDFDAATLTVGSPLAAPLPNYSINAVGFFGAMSAGKIRLDEVWASGVAASFPATPPTVGAISLTPTNRVDGTAWTGTPVTFQVSAAGTVPLTYIWRKNGAVLPSTTTPTWTIASPSTNDSGSYDVIVTNISGSAVTSAPVVLTVSPNQVFVNQHFVSTNDPGIIGQLPGWHALAFSFTNSAVTDYTLLPNPPINPNYPNLSTGPGSDGTAGYLVLGQGDTVNPVLVWMETPPALQQSQVSNILFSTRNAFFSSTMQVAVQVAGQWYVSTTVIQDTSGGVVPWVNQNFQFTSAAGAWQTFDISTLTPGAVTTDPLTNAPITGIGIYGDMVGVATARIRIDEFLVDGLGAAAAVAPQPTIQTVFRDGSGNLVVRTATTGGFNYILESTPALQSPIVWTPVSTNAGTGGVITNLVPFNPATPKQFFRYHVQ